MTVKSNLSDAWFAKAEACDRYNIADPRRARYDQSRGNAEQRYTIVFPAGGHNESLFT
jgi:hypothetical protein